MRRAALLAVMLAVGCGDAAGDLDAGTFDVDAASVDAGSDPGPLGFIGSPCAAVADCEYDAAVCLTEGFPGGSCSQPCTLICPDRDGHPTTFCVDIDELPTSAGELGDGACVSRCDYGVFPDTGCRDGYGCVRAPRANEPATEVYVCLPGRDPEMSSCYADLAALGVAFEPTVIADAHPDTHPSLTCHIEEPVYILSPVHGVELTSSSGTVTPRVLGSCAMAHALSATVDDVAPLGVVAIEHLGTYNCRVIAGTDSLSRHAYGDALDIAGFRFADGTRYTLTDDWEHDTDSPMTDGGAFLYAAAHRWYDALLWNIILTPNYNAAHDDHFHVDLTPGSHVIGAPGVPAPFAGPYIGPAPYAD